MRKSPLLELLRTRFPDISEKELFSAVLRGRVSVDGRPADKPNRPVPVESEITLKGAPRYVSRGGEKLAHALDAWGWEVEGKVFIDAGASTGGFTDCLLERGAARVYAVDVGYNQLDYSLRRDARVTVMERMNVMALSPRDFGTAPHRAVADLSFRSLRGAARHILDLTSEGQGIFLAKPQFEQTNPGPDFRGVVKDAERLSEILDALLRDLSAEGVRVLKTAQSPILGRKGNREFLLLLSRLDP